MPSFKSLNMDLAGHVARIDLNRPERANSADEFMWRELRSVFDELDDMKEVRAVILGGAGRHFCSGIDLDYLGSIRDEIESRPEGYRQERLNDMIVALQASVSAIERCRKPVLAAIQGVCMGAGVDIAAACDIRYATDTARFSVKEVDLAIVADLGSLQRLPRIVGEGIARELSFTGRVFKGKEALDMGFVNQVYKTADDLKAGVMAVAVGLTEKSPLTLRGIKETLNYSRDHSVSEGLRFVAKRNAATLLSKDLDEALAAFFDKRRPIFDD